MAVLDSEIATAQTSEFSLSEDRDAKVECHLYCFLTGQRAIYVFSSTRKQEIMLSTSLGVVLEGKQDVLEVEINITDRDAWSTEKELRFGNRFFVLCTTPSSITSITLVTYTSVNASEL